MTIEPAIGIGISVFGAILLIAGIVGLIRDGRRIATPVYLVMGLGLVSIGAGLLLNNLGHPALLTIVLVVMGSILVLGNIVGYPALVIFLLYSGITIWRKETRTLGNALALLAGIALFFLPATLRWLAPPETVSLDADYVAWVPVPLAVVLVVSASGVAFGEVIAATLPRLWPPVRAAAGVIIVFGSGAISGNGPRCLAARLDRGIAVYQK